MKSGLTEIVFILDSNPSAPDFDKQARKSLGNFFSAMKKKDSEIKVTFAVYGSSGGYKIFADDVPVAALRMSAKYFEKGNGTRDLFDSAAGAIYEKGTAYSRTDESEHPENVIFVITAFGRDNASKSNTYSKVAEIIGHQAYVYKWRFFCLTTDTTVSSQLGIPAEAVMMLDLEDEDFLGKGLGELQKKISEIV